MAKTCAFWVTGYNFFAQAMGNPVLNSTGNPYYDANGQRTGNGVTFWQEAGQNNWYHIAIPTPVILEDKRAKIGRVIALFSTPKNTAALTAVHVFDGPNNIMQFGGLNVDGDHSQGVDASNTWNVNRDGVAFGIGVSMNIACTADSKIFFGGAGVDFIHDI